MDTLEDIIKQVIIDIREKKKKKPDTKFTLREAESKHGPSYTSEKSVLDQTLFLIKDKKITVNEEDSHFINSRSNSINEAVNKTIPLEPEDSKLEDASSPGIIIVGASKDRDTGVPHPNPPPPTVNTDISMVLSTLEALASGLGSTNQLLHQERAFNKAILQENLELKLQIKELEVKNSHLLDDVIPVEHQESNARRRVTQILIYWTKYSSRGVRNSPVH